MNFILLPPGLKNDYFYYSGPHFLYIYWEAGVYDVICFPEEPQVPTPILKNKK